MPASANYGENYWKRHRRAKENERYQLFIPASTSDGVP